MMKKVSLLNLDIGENPISWKFKVGPLSISLKNDYHQLRDVLNKHQDAETAEVVYDLLGTALLCRSNLRHPQEAIWDLFYILSYLTGRVVVIPEYSYRFNTKHAGGDLIIDEHDFMEALNTAWLNRSNFKGDIEKRPLWLYFEYIQTPNLENKLIFASIALEIILDLILKDVKIDDGIDSEVLKLSSLKNNLNNLIKKSDISDELKQVFLTNIGNWSGQKSVEGIKRYLFERKFIDKINVIGNVRERIQFINRLRNSILHRAEVRAPNENINIEQIYSFSSVFLPALIQDYLNSKFNLQHFNKVRQTHDYMKAFLYAGKCPHVIWSFPK